LSWLQPIGFNILSFVFVLGVMIFVHELGHFLVAKFLRIRVEVFSLGFGYRLIGFKRGDTDYRISLLPLGGYVKMAGENYDDDLTGDPGEFVAHPKMHRFAVAVAGPVMNLVLAFVLVTATFVLGVPVAKYVRQPGVIGTVAQDSPAARMGLLPGDTIVAIDGDATPTWQEVELQISISPNQQLIFLIDRAGNTFQQEITTSVAEGMEIGTIGVRPFIPYVIASVEPGSPANTAGLLPGDEILDVSDDARTVSGFNESAELIYDSEGLPLRFRVLRGSQVLEMDIAAVEMNDRWRIGTAVDVMELEQHGLLGALDRSFERNYRLTQLTFDVVGKIVTGKTSLRAMSGPIEIARFSGMAVSLGFTQLLNFMALISLQLGIFNLMPIPILDGGVIALLGIEGLLRKDLSIQLKERIFQVGFVFLILLMGIVIFNDLAKNLPILD